MKQKSQQVLTSRFLSTLLLGTCVQYAKGMRYAVSPSISVRADCQQPGAVAHRPSPEQVERGW